MRGRKKRVKAGKNACRTSEAAQVKAYMQVLSAREQEAENKSQAEKETQGRKNSGGFLLKCPPSDATRSCLKVGSP